MKHLGITAPSRFTLSYTNNAHCPWELYPPVFFRLLRQLRSRREGQKKFRFKTKLASLASTIIDMWITFAGRKHGRVEKNIPQILARNLPSILDPHRVFK